MPTFDADPYPYGEPLPSPVTAGARGGQT
jgi:hypothetical protein